MTKKTAVVKQDNTIAPVNLGELEGMGFEDTRHDELQIPFLALLQDLSAQVKGTTKIDGAEVGMFYNTVTGELYDADKTVLEFAPATRDHCYVEWTPRKKGGGLVARHELDSPVVAKAKAESEEFGKYKTPEGNDLVETYYVYGVLTVDGEAQPICIAFKSGYIKPWKKYFTQMSYTQVPSTDGRKQKPPMCCHRIRVQSIDDKSKGGDEFKNFKLTPINGTIKQSLQLDTETESIQLAIGMVDAIKAGAVNVDYEAERGSSQGGDDDSDPEGVFDDGVC